MNRDRKLWSTYSSDYATFQKVLRRLRLPADIWPDLAVMFAEIKAPTVAVADMLNRICQTQKCTKRELLRLQELISYRWRWHAEDLDRLLQKLEESGYGETETRAQVQRRQRRRRGSHRRNR